MYEGSAVFIPEVLGLPWRGGGYGHYLSIPSLGKRSHLGCVMHLVGKELGAGGREWEESPTGAGKKEVHCL